MQRRGYPLKLLIILSALILLLGLFLFTCKDCGIASDYYLITPAAAHNNGKAFAGGKSCIPCHNSIYDTHSNTAHYKTSAVANASNIKGSFEPGKNSFILNNRTQFTLTATDSGFYQRANFLHNQLELFNIPIDLVFGSGTKGQSYLNWEGDKLFQLQTSYFTPADCWTTSPGLENLRTRRPIMPRCFECHSTFAKNLGPNRQTNQYSKKEIILGIDCERCHGPAAKHVGYQQKNPTAKTAKYILKYSELSRQQRLDACALCHSGAGRKALSPPFSFLAGDDLSKFYLPNEEEIGKTLDVHGNQYGLLASSSCFKNSNQMDCTTCHNPHKNQRGNAKNFNTKCIACHAQSQLSCEQDIKSTPLSMQNCIACHMPLIPSKSMVIQLDSVKTAVKVRTHLIDVYVNQLNEK